MAVSFIGGGKSKYKCTRAKPAATEYTGYPR